VLTTALSTNQIKPPTVLRPSSAATRANSGCRPARAVMHQSDVWFIHRRLSTTRHYEKNRMAKREARVTHILINRQARETTRTQRRSSTGVHRRGQSAPSIRPPSIFPDSPITLFSERCLIHSVEGNEFKTAKRCTSMHDSNSLPADPKSRKQFRVRNQRQSRKLKPEATAAAKFNNLLNSSTSARSNRAA